MDDWIPISSTQSLPDDWVLVVVDFHEPGSCRRALRAYYEPRDCTWRTEYGRIKSHWEVTHWMTIPDLPEVES